MPESHCVTTYSCYWGIIGERDLLLLPHSSMSASRDIMSLLPSLSTQHYYAVITQMLCHYLHTQMFLQMLVVSLKHWVVHSCTLTPPQITGMSTVNTEAIWDLVSNVIGVTHAATGSHCSIIFCTPKFGLKDDHMPAQWWLKCDGWWQQPLSVQQRLPLSSGWMPVQP